MKKCNFGELVEDVLQNILRKIDEDSDYLLIMPEREYRLYRWCLNRSH